MLVHFLINQHVGILRILSRLLPPPPRGRSTIVSLTLIRDASEGLVLEVLYIEFLHLRIVELEPLFVVAFSFHIDIGEIMPEFRCSDMDHNSHKLVMCVDVLQPWHHIAIQLQVNWEFQPRINFFILQCVQVENDSLEVQNQHVREGRQKLPLCELHLLLAVIALVIRDDLARNKLLEALG